MKCLQIHNDYIIPGGETNSVNLIGDVMEQNNIDVIRYYKCNKKLNDMNMIQRIKSGINSIFNLEVVKEIDEILDSNNIDFAIIHNTSPLISNSIYYILKKRNIPIFKYVQNYNLLCLNGEKNVGDSVCAKCIGNNCNNGVYRRCYKKSIIYTIIKFINKKIFDRFYIDNIKKFITISDFIKKEHIKYGISGKKMEVLPHFVDSYAEYYGEKKRYYLYYGRLTKEKGILTLLNAFKKNKNINLYIMGKGELEYYIRNFIDRNKLTNIKLLGYLVGNAKENYIKEAYCTIVPSVWDEPFGRVVIESYSYGTPVIGSDRGGIPELIVSNKTGLVFEGGNTNSLISKINYIENLGEEEYKVMRKECIKICINKFSKENYIKSLKKIIESKE